jgi:NADPH:quinone reductase-like Zn-dependent oxidoreductase
MPRAVRFEKYGGIDVLHLVEVDRPVPGPEQVLVRVKAAGINPGEAAIREGVFAKQWPAKFPSGQGSDLAGIVEEVGTAVKNVAVGDEVIGPLTSTINTECGLAYRNSFTVPEISIGCAVSNIANE